jgi:hypothetical protein
MIAALLLVGVCNAIPNFASGLPACSATNQSVECYCSECFTWDVPLGHVARYEIYRSQASVQGSTLVGVTKEQVTVDRDDGYRYTVHSPPAVWCPALDVPMVQEGVRYSYQVLACNGLGCSALSASIVYVGAPYVINQFRPPIVGNP